MLCASSKCTGCFACLNMCPKGAISVVSDKLGFLHPKISEAFCMKCGRCERTCPEKTPVNTHETDNVCAVYSTDKTIRESSTSGGLAQVLSRYALRKGWIVFSHAFSDDYSLTCRRITSEDQLERVNGTKYVQSYVGDAIKSIIEDLNKQREVLFIGTPCQVAGVENATKNNNRNLLTVSFVCGGVPSNQFFKDYISRLKIEGAQDIHFRKNNQYGLYAIINGKTVQIEERWKSCYFIGFDEHIIQRDSCYSCRYASKERVGDITIGDFWGIENTDSHIDSIENGVSLCIPTTEKGKRVIENCHKEELLYMEPHTFDDAAKMNPRLLSPVYRKNQVDIFRKLYTKYGFGKAITKLYGKKYAIMRIKRYFKRITLLDKLYHKVINK